MMTKRRVLSMLLSLVLLAGIAVFPTNALADSVATRKNPAYLDETVPYVNYNPFSYYDNYVCAISMGPVIRGDEAAALIYLANSNNQAPSANQEYIIAMVYIGLLSSMNDSAVSFDSYQFRAYSSSGVRYDNVTVSGLTPSLNKTYPEGVTYGCLVFLVNKGDDPLIVFNESGYSQAWFSLKEAPVTETGRTAYVFSGSLNMRSLPSSDSELLMKFNYGDKFTVMDGKSSNTWWKVKHEGTGLVGWVARAYVGKSVSEMAENSQIEVKSTSINLRESANSSAGIVAKLPKGAKLTLLDKTTSKSWVKVKTADGKIGWVGAVYVGGSF